MSRQSLCLDVFKRPESIPLLTEFFDPTLDYVGYSDRCLAARLNMEEHLMAGGSVLPPLRRVVDVTTPVGTRVVSIPSVSSDVSLAVAEVPLAWTTDAYLLILDLLAMVR